MTRATSTDPNRNRPSGESRPADGRGGQITDALPPYSLEAEMSLLGSMMLSRDAVGDVIPIIGKEHAEWFYRPDHQVLFTALLELYDRNEPIDLLVLKTELERRDLLEEVGGVDYLIACAESVPSHLHARHYAGIVRDKGLLRDLIRCAQSISSDAYTSSDPARSVFERAEQELYRVTELRVASRSEPISDLVRQIVDQYKSGDEGALSGLATGYHELDDLTTGFQPGDLIIVAGRPSMGKTSLGLNMAEHMAVDADIPVAFFSLEMSKQQVAQRLICGRQKVDMQRFRQRMLSHEEKEQLEFSCGQYQDVPLFVDDTPGMTLLELRTKARRLAQQRSIRAVFVDYLQLMQAPGSESRQQEISTISGGLKSLGRELEIPIVALAQLNRMVEGRTGNRPRMSDLRESGAIEQDADVILLLHREEYYNKEDPNLKNKAEIIVAKQRNGPTDTIELHFDHRYTRFGNLAHVDETSYVASESGGVPF